MRSKEQIKACIKTLQKLKGLDMVEFADLEKNYGEHWAVIFDELRKLKVVYPPVDGKVRINQNYLESALTHYKAILNDYSRATMSEIRSWIALAISILALLVSVLSKQLAK